MSTETAYRELGLAPGASDAEVKAAWRRLVSRWHPDRNASRAAVEKMQRINQAFELLRDVAGAMPGAAAQTGAKQPPCRAERTEEAAAPSGPAEPHAGTAPPGGSRPPAAKPVKRRIKLTLEEAALGCLRVLNGRLTHACGACEGAGLRWLGSGCAGCSGSGHVRERAWYGWLSNTVTCADCGGDGRARETCSACSGAGKLPPREYALRVRIPAGVRHGDVLCVPGGASGPPGGFDLQIELLPHAFFRLDDDGSMHCEMPVDGFRWIGGRTVEVPTPAGRGLSGQPPGAARRSRHDGETGVSAIVVHRPADPAGPPDRHLGRGPGRCLGRLAAAIGRLGTAGCRTRRPGSSALRLGSAGNLGRHP